MTRVSVAFNESTQVPYLGLVSDGETFQVVNVGGQIPGSEVTMREMQGLFTVDGLDLFRVFELYAASFGMTASAPVEVLGGVADNAVRTTNELALAQGVGSPARNWMLQRVANARSELNLDSLAVMDVSQFDPELGVDSAWLPEARQVFLDAAGWEPYTLSAPEVDLAAALQVRMAMWDAVPHVENPIVLPEGEPVPEAGYAPAVEALPVEAVPVLEAAPPAAAANDEVEGS